MNRNFAFKLCGELSRTAINLSPAVSAGNTAKVCLDAGIELLEMTSSLISYCEERNRTKLKESAYRDNKLKYEKLRDEEYKQANIFIKREENDCRRRIELLKIDLEKENHELKQKLELASALLQYSSEDQAKMNKRVSKIRSMTKAAIDLVSIQLKQFSVEKPNDTILIGELQEKLRVSVAQYQKLVDICCQEEK